MPLESLLQPVAELIMYVVGYLTAQVVVPIATGGCVQVEDLSSKRVKAKGGRIRREADGRRVMDAELAALIGFLFWLAIAVGVYFVLRPR